MKKLGRAVLVAAVTGSLVVTPVYAAPDTSDLEHSKAAAQNEADSLQEQLTELLNKAGELEEKMISTGEKIIQAQNDLEDAQQKAQEQYDSMKLRIRYMYENGQSDAMETLISSQDFSDFINKAQYIQNVHSYDRQQLQKLEDTENEIEDLKSTLEEEQDKQEKMQAEYETQEAQLNATLEEKKAEVADFDQQIQAAAEAAAQEAEQREAASEETAADGGNGTVQDNSNSASAQSGSSNGSTNNSSNSGSTSVQGSSNNGASGTGGGSSSGTVSSGSSSGSVSSGSSSGNTSAAQAIINAAYSQLGVPYVYGGSTPGAAFDCSGFVQYCYSVAGISLPRTSQAQGGCGVAVTNPQPGDIVCYGTHVGIYIGNGQMIHAPKPGDVVKIASVYGSPWYRRCW